jgi:hypothetical protein
MRSRTSTRYEVEVFLPTGDELREIALVGDSRGRAENVLKSGAIHRLLAAATWPT